MNGLEGSKPPDRSEPLDEELAGQLKGLDGRYKGSPARLLEAKLLATRYLLIPEYSIKSPTDSPEERQIFENAMRESVEGAINEARTGEATVAYERANLLKRSIEADKGDVFGIWFGYRGKLIGEKRCNEIGSEVVEQMQFTSEEADKIMGEHRESYEREVKKLESEFPSEEKTEGRSEEAAK